jgi:hypothetical protein
MFANKEAPETLKKNDSRVSTLTQIKEWRCMPEEKSNLRVRHPRSNIKARHCGLEEL